MIVTKLKGGLGNQMFQYACGRALSLRSGNPFFLDTSSYSKTTAGETPRNFCLDIFNIEAEILPDGQAEKIAYPFDSLSKLSARIYRKLFKKYNIGFDQKTLEQMNAKAAQKKNLYLEGFWWSESYFKDASDAIRKDFSLKSPFGPEAQKIADLISASAKSRKSTISVHFRRGDYVSHKNTNAYHGICSNEYYEAGVKKILEQTGPNVHLFMVSDDIEWVKTNVHFPYEMTHVPIPPAIQDPEALILMSMCQHNIIANSSFSWWGAWLNQNPQKIVIAPAKWTQKTIKDSKGMIPETWVRI